MFFSEKKCHGREMEMDLEFHVAGIHIFALPFCQTHDVCGEDRD